MLPCWPVDRRWILGGLLGVGGGICLVRALTSRPRLNEDSRVLVIGDSLAKGMAPHFKALAQDDELPLVSGAIEGTRVDQWVDSSWLRQQLDEFEPTHVIISLGTNDAYTNFDPDAVGADAEELDRLIRDAGAAPVWIGAPDLPDQSSGKPINTDVLDAIEDSATYYFDSTDYEIPRGNDNLHPTATGYAGWAGVIWNWLS